MNPADYVGKKVWRFTSYTKGVEEVEIISVRADYSVDSVHTFFEVIDEDNKVHNPLHSHESEHGDDIYFSLEEAQEAFDKHIRYLKERARHDYEQDLEAIAKYENKNKTKEMK